MTTIELIITKWLIKRLKWGYGEGCPDYVKECIACRAKVACEFLEEHLTILK